MSVGSMALDGRLGRLDVGPVEREQVAGERSEPRRRARTWVRTPRPIRAGTSRPLAATDGQHLEKEGRLPDTGLSVHQGGRSGNHAPRQNSIELAHPGRSGRAAADRTSARDRRAAPPLLRRVVAGCGTGPPRGGRLIESVPGAAASGTGPPSEATMAPQRRSGSKRRASRGPVLMARTLRRGCRHRRGHVGYPPRPAPRQASRYRRRRGAGELHRRWLDPLDRREGQLRPVAPSMGESSTSTTIVSPTRNSFHRIRSDKGSSTSCWMARRSGRAPSWGS